MITKVFYIFYTVIFPVFTLALFVTAFVIGAIGVYKWDETSRQLEEVREELHWLRVTTGYTLGNVDTARWALEEFNSAMDSYERETTENGHYYYFGNLGDDAFPLLRYVAEASNFGYVTDAEAAEAASRMERYLQAQPGPDELSEQSLAQVWDTIGQ